MPSYRYCFVPTCANSSRKTPEKLFIFITGKLRERWYKQLNLRTFSKNAFCCEDHLNLEEDLENYHEWKVNNAKPKIKLTANLHLEKSAEEPSSVKRLLQDSSSSHNIPSDKKRKTTSCTSVSPEIEPTASTSMSFEVILPTQVHASTQTTTVEVAHKKIQTTVNTQARPIIPIDSTPTTISTSPSLFSGEESPSATSASVQTQEKTIRKEMIQLINDYPKQYIGVPKNFIWIVKYILNQSVSPVNEVYLLITLFKIKQNDTFERLSHQFQLSKSSIIQNFGNSVIMLANFFTNLIYLPEPLKIKQNLPLAFKIRYSNVQMIIDAFEIEIEKPCNPQRQAQTWSQYKNCNTVKYLIGCTPNGFVSYISKGYGGRISDKSLVEKSDLLEILPINATIMADRGFKEIESSLISKNIKLLRPPSVYSSIKPTKEQVIQTKVIASLRVHIERVIRRVREFKLLKPHSVINHNHLGHLDKMVIIACGLINLQGEIIRR